MNLYKICLKPVANLMAMKVHRELKETECNHFWDIFHTRDSLSIAICGSLAHTEVRKGD